jgi:hypothetical protein
VILPINDFIYICNFYWYVECHIFIGTLSATTMSVVMVNVVAPSKWLNTLIVLVLDFLGDNALNRACG